MHDPTGRDTTRYPNAAHETARTGLKNRSRANSSRSWIVTVAILLTIVIAGSMIFAGDQDDAQAQNQSPPLLSAVIYDGWVTVGNDPLGLTGLTLSAKVGEWVSDSVIIGEGTPDLNGFKDLTIEPPSELLGRPNHISCSVAQSKRQIPTTTRSSKQTAAYARYVRLPSRNSAATLASISRHARPVHLSRRNRR